MKFGSYCGLALLLLVGGTAKAQNRDDYEVTCRHEVANRFGVKKHDVRTQTQGEEYGKTRVRWTYNQRNGICEYDSRMNLMAFREFGENSGNRYDNRDSNRHGDDNYRDRQPVVIVYPVRADTSGRGTFSGSNGGTVRITRGWVDTTGDPTVSLSGEHNFKITFRGEAVRANGDREFTIRIRNSDHGDADGVATVRLNGDKNEVESINISGHLNGGRFDGMFNR
jgi:hypothetical protein